MTFASDGIINIRYSFLWADGDEGMLPFEFIIEGTPVSHQTRNAQCLRAWQQAVRIAAQQRWPVNIAPIVVRLRFSVTYYRDGVAVRMDKDNLVKPIQDALNGLIYEDDRQITDTHIRKTDLNGSFRFRGMSPVLAEGFCRGNKFLYVWVELAPNHEELI